MFYKDLFKLCYRCIYVFKGHGGISDCRILFAFQHLARKDTRSDVGPFCLCTCKKKKKKRNQIGNVVFQSMSVVRAPSV